LKTNVLHIIDSLLTGGAETIAVNTVNELNDTSDVNAYLCCTRKEGPLKQLVVDKERYLFLNKKKVIDFRALKLLSSFIEKNEISILHAHTTSFFIAVLIKLRLPKIKILWHNHTGANIELKGGRLLFIKCCSLFFYANIHVNEDLNYWAKKKLYVVRNMVLNNFAKIADVVPYTILKGKESRKIVCLAALRSEKDHINLLSAFISVLENIDDVSLHLVGTNYKNNYAKSLEQKIAENNLAHKVFLYGNCTDVKHILSQASIGVLSSKTEGLPIALLEYGLSSLPVIVTNVGDCIKVVKNEVTGLVVEKENNMELAKGIMRLLNKTPETLQFGNNLNKFVIDNYGVNGYIRDLIASYNSVL